MTIKAIETWYAGCKFRSRLEARWAVFFDASGIEWEYEPQGFLIEDPTYDWDQHWVPDETSKIGWRKLPPLRPPHRPYLPDFLLPQSKTWVEVKGDADSLRKHSTLYACATDGNRGLPYVHESAYQSARGLLLLGPIPDVRYPMIPLHPIIQHYRDLHVNGLLLINPMPDSFRVATWDDIVGDSYSDGLSMEKDGGFSDPLPLVPAMLEMRESPAVAAGQEVLYAAYRAARSARFEHGQRGRSR